MIRINKIINDFKVKYLNKNNETEKKLTGKLKNVEDCKVQEIRKR